MSYQGAVRRLREELGDLLEARETVQDLTAYRDYDGRPQDFFCEVLDWTPWSKQVEATVAIEENALTALVGAQGVGKDALLSAFSLYWVYAKGGLVLMTAPTQRQIRAVLFGEISRLWHGTDLPGELFTSALRLGPESDAGIIGFTSTAVSALTGFHGSRVLGVLSEAQGLEGDAWEGISACCVGALDRIVCSGNPLFPSGRFHAAAMSDAWVTITIRAADHPNIAEARTVIPGGPSLQWQERMANEYGIGSNTYRSRVLSEFPDQGEESLFSRSWLDASAERWGSEDAPRGLVAPVVALDVARYGPDSSVAVVRRGMRVETIHEWKNASTTETVARAAEIAREAGVRGSEDPDGSWGLIMVDEVGLGAGVLDELQRVLPCRGFNGGQKAKDPSRFLNLRAESYWRLRKLCEDGGISMPPDDRLFDELLAVRWFPTGDGKVQIEAKQDLKTRLGRSPDKMDALTMAYSVAAHPVGGFMHVAGKTYDLETGLQVDDDSGPTKKENPVNRREIEARRRRARAQEALNALGRGFRLTGSNLEREFISYAIAASYRSDSRRRYVGGHWLGFESGMRFEVRGLGVVYIPAEATLLAAENRADIAMRCSLEPEQSRGLRFRDGFRPEGGFEATTPEQVQTIILDFGRHILTTDPEVARLEVTDRPDPASRLLADEEEMTDFIREIIFRSLGIRAVQSQTLQG